MKIEKGNKFLCTKDVIMFDGDIAYKKGEIYQSECDGCITNVYSEVDHRWPSEEAPRAYFKLLSEVDRAQEEDYEDPYNWVVNGMKNNIKYDKPTHYSKGIDTFARMEANCTKEECLAFIKGNIDKYNWRDKGQDLEDFDKIISYAKWAKSILNKNDWNI